MYHTKVQVTTLRHGGGGEVEVKQGQFSWGNARRDCLGYNK